MRWNLKIERRRRRDLVDAVESSGGRLIHELVNVPWVTVDLPDHIDPMMLPEVVEAEVDDQGNLLFDPNLSWGALRVNAGQVRATEVILGQIGAGKPCSTEVSAGKVKLLPTTPMLLPPAGNGVSFTLGQVNVLRLGLETAPLLVLLTAGSDSPTRA